MSRIAITSIEEMKSQPKVAKGCRQDQFYHKEWVTLATSSINNALSLSNTRTGISVVGN